MSDQQLPTRLASIRSRARQHQEELESLRWFTPQRLAARWDVSATTVMDIPRDQLPYKTFGSGEKLKRRRYHPDDVAAFESTGRVPRQPDRASA